MIKQNVDVLNVYPLNFYPNSYRLDISGKSADLLVHVKASVSSLQLSSVKFQLKM